MVITEKFLTPNKYSRPGFKLEKVTKIAVHYVGNPGSSAIANRNYFENQKNGGTYVSAHFVIGLEGEIIQCIPLDEWSYCTNQANGYSISIECCHPDSTGKFNAKTEASLAELCAYLLKKFGLSSEDIIRHYDVTGKQCPLYWSPTKYQSAEVANSRFAAFKDRVRKMLNAEEKSSAKFFVQVGAFDTKEYAEAFLKTVKSKYPEAFIKVSGKYYVQVGAFSSRANAEAYLETVKKDYPGAFIKTM